jgi:hypothetical protein
MVINTVGLYQVVAGAMGSSQMHCFYKYSLKLKCLHPEMSEIEDVISPAAGPFLPLLEIHCCLERQQKVVRPH